MDECPEARVGANDERCNSGLIVSKTLEYEKSGIPESIGRAKTLGSECGESGIGRVDDPWLMAIRIREARVRWNL